MRTALQIDVTFEQILSLIKQMPVQQKVKIAKELGKEGIDTKLTKLLKVFKTKELTMDTITEEVEIVRQKMYDNKKH